MLRCMVEEVLAVVAWQVSGIPKQGWGDEVSE